MNESLPNKTYSTPYTYPEAGDLQEDDFLLEPVIQTLRNYKHLILRTLLAAAVVIAIGALAVYLLAPSYKVARLGFRLDFEGIDKGEYPNGTKFSPAEIVSTPVINQVYEQDNLGQYGSFEKFKNSVFVLESNPEVEKISAEFRARLSDTKLSPVDRERITKEYDKRLESVSKSQYSLNISRIERGFAMPPDLMAKVLNDILAAWADNTGKRSGALQYQVPVYSRNIIQKEFFDAEDYLIAVDVLRSKILRVLGDIQIISALPGANVLRIGKERLSLPEVRANLEDLLRFQLEPLSRQIRSKGVTKDPRTTVLYFQNRLSQLKLDKEEATGRLRALQDALGQYMQDKTGQLTGKVPGASSSSGQAVDRSVPALIPQFGESFLDRIIEMSRESNDFKFRQDITSRIVNEGLNTVTLEKEAAYYEQVLGEIRGLAGASAPPAAGDLARKASDKIMADTLKLIDQTNAIYKELSAQNLNPRTLLYTVTTPVDVSTDHSVGARKLLLYVLILLSVTAVATVVGCLLHGRFASKPALQEPARTAVK